MPFSSLPAWHRLRAIVGFSVFGIGLSIEVFQPRAAVSTSSIAVVRSNDNDRYWSEIEQRLQTAEVGYHTLEWDDVEDVSDLGDSKVLFLLNLEDISRRQASAIETWLGSGGRIIVSGRFAEESSRQVRDGLRNVIGMQWLDELPSSAAMRLLSTSCDRDPACRTAWMPDEALGRIPDGGILSLSGGDSQAAAAWQMAGNATAVGVSPQVTFLGWEWGRSDRAIEADVAWLKAALRRSQDLEPGSPDAEFEPVAWNEPMPTSPQSESRDSSPTRFDDSASRITFDSFDSTDSTDSIQPIATDTRPRNTGTETEPIATITNRLDRPANSTNPNPNPDRLAPPLPSVSRSPIAPASNTTGNSNTTGDNLLALRVAPAGLTVERGDDRISQIEALKMQRELSDLIGRVQSATQAARAVQVNHRIAVAEEDETETDRLTSPSNRNREYIVALTPDQPIDLGATATILDQARATLADFPGLVAAGAYREARDRWIDARLALLDSYPDASQRAQPEIRAIWLDRGTIVEAGSAAGLERLFDRLEAMGITIVFLKRLTQATRFIPVPLPVKIH